MKSSTTMAILLMTLFPVISNAQTENKGVHIFGNLEGNKHKLTAKIQNSRGFPKTTMAISEQITDNFDKYTAAKSFAVGDLNGNIQIDSDNNNIVKTTFTPKHFYIGVGAEKQTKNAKILTRAGLIYPHYSFKIGNLEEINDKSANSLINVLYTSRFGPLYLDASGFFGNHKLDKATILGGYIGEKLCVIYAGVKRGDHDIQKLKIIKNHYVTEKDFNGAFNEISDPLSYILTETTGTLINTYGNYIFEITYDNKLEKYTTNVYATKQFGKTLISGSVGYGKDIRYGLGARIGPLYIQLEKDSNGINTRADFFVGLPNGRLELH